MARIPTAANVGQAPSPRDPGVSVPAVGQEIARGIQDIGRGLGVIAEKQQIAEDRRFLADYDSEVRTRAAEAVLGLDGQQESSTYASQVEQAVGQLGPSILKDFESRGYTPSQDARTRADVGFTGLLTSTRVSAITDQHNAKVAAALRGIQNNADLHVNTLRDNPSQEALTATLGQLDEVFAQAEGMANPSVVAASRDQYRGMAYTAFTEGLISRNRLGEARAVLSTEAANAALDPKTKSALTRQLDTLLRQRANAAKSDAKALLAVETGQALDVVLNQVQNNPSPSAVDRGLTEIGAILEGTAGEFTPAQLATLKQTYSSKVWSRYVDGLVASGHHTLAEDILQSDPATNTMTASDMDAARNALDRAQAVRQNQLEGIAKSSVGDVKKLVLGGRRPDTTEAWRDVAQLPEDQQAAFAGQLQAWEMVSQKFADLATRPSADRAKVRADVVEAQGRPVTPQSAEYYAAVLELLDDADAQQREDATVLAVRAGVPPPETDFDLQDPNTYGSTVGLANQTVAMYGLDAQVLPRAAYDSIKQALADGTNAEGYAAIDVLGGLNPPALQAVLGKLGDTASPAIRHAVSLARTNPQLAKALVNASHVDPKLPRPDNKDLLKNPDLNLSGSQAFPGPLQGLFYDSLEAAKSLAASRVLSSGGDASNLVDATVAAFDEMYAGLLVTVNGSKVLLPPELRDTPSSPTVLKVEDTLPRLETPEAQGRVLVPTAQGSPVALPKGAVLKGLFYPGTETKVPWSEVASAPLGAPIAPGVYAPRVDGSTQGHVVGRYTFLSNGVEVTHDFPVALSLPAVLKERPTNTVPDNVRLLQDRVRTLQATGKTATPEYREAVERLKELAQ